MATPHPNSQVSPVIAGFSQELYDKLITMESVCYTTPIGGTAVQYQPIWKAYSDAWVGYTQSIKLKEVQASSLVMALYSFITLHFGYGVGTPAFFEECKASGIFNSGGLIDVVLGYPDNYYNDLIVPPAPIPPAVEVLEPYSPHIDADIAKIPGAVTGDIRRFDVLVQEKIPTLIQGYQMGVLFGTPTVPETMLPKPEMWDMIFITMGWKATFEAMGVQSVIPPRP